MARQLTSVPNTDAPDSEYPAGKIRNDNPPTDGTPVIEELYGDITQFFHKLMRLAGLSYNDLPENETQGFQFVQAMAAYIRTLNASTAEKGVVELATNAETQAGIDTQRAITPAGLESKTATTTRNGIAELATNTEVQTGTDAERIVTPAGLSARTATESRTGIAEIATQTETRLGSDDTKIVTPAKLKSKIKAGMYHVGDIPSAGISVTITHNMGFSAGNYVVLITQYTPSSQGGDNDIQTFRVFSKAANSFVVRIEESAGQVQDMWIDWCVMPIDS